ncbi:MAG TPA: lyase family protein [Acidimicrobiales bacterium]|nr:lyase family protein [Acidimicrobiales bacterium]
MDGTSGLPTRSPAPELIGAGFAYESQGAAILHDGLNLADLAHVLDLLDRGIIPHEAGVALLRVVLDASMEAVGYDPRDGEPYNSRERAFAAQIGSAAGWLHAGRPRREATRLAFRLHLRRRTAELALAAVELARALAARAGEYRQLLFPDQTYLQHAQPSTVGHYLSSFAYPVIRDGRRLLDVFGWLNRSPAGAGCVNGTRLQSDRVAMADRLGFDGVIANTRDAMWQVDGLVQLVSTLASLALTQDSLAEDLEIWASSEFDYVALADEYTRASVLMPQKRNPYSLAMIRGTTGVLIGHVAGTLAVQKSPSARSDNLIFAYGEIPVALEHARRMTDLTTGVVATLTMNAARLREELAGGYSQSTDVAEELMLSGGIDYRTAYDIVGAAVRRLALEGRGAGDLTPPLLDQIAVEQVGRPLGIDDARLADALDPAAIVATRVATGGAAREPMGAMLAELAGDADALGGAARERVDAIDGAEQRLVAVARRVIGEGTP